jgi:hypothetical protein
MRCAGIQGNGDKVKRKSAKTLKWDLVQEHIEPDVVANACGPSYL